MRYLLFGLSFFLLVSCAKKDSANAKFSELPDSIQKIITEAQRKCPVGGITIGKFKYNNELIYGTECNGALADCIMILYNGQGELIHYDIEEYQDIKAKIILIEELYKCVNEDYSTIRWTE